MNRQGTLHSQSLLTKLVVNLEVLLIFLSCCLIIYQSERRVVFLFLFFFITSSYSCLYTCKVTQRCSRILRELQAQEKIYQALKKSQCCTQKFTNVAFSHSSYRISELRGWGALELSCFRMSIMLHCFLMEDFTVAQISLRATYLETSYDVFNT